MAHYTAEQLLGQAFVAFGQGAGAIRVHTETIDAIRGRYEPYLTEALKLWETEASQALERVRSAGRTAALIATQAGRMAISADDFLKAVELVQAEDIKLLGRATRICQPPSPQR